MKFLSYFSVSLFFVSSLIARDINNQKISKNLHRSIPNELNGSKIFANGIPKAGNHLLLKCLRLLTNRRHHWIPGFAIINKGQVDNLNSKSILSAHAISNQNNLNLISSKQGLKGFFILRDPRDQLISKLHWIFKQDKEKNKNKSDEILMDLIVDGKNYNNPKLICPEIEKINGVADYYNLFLNWLNCPNVYTVRFEKIIGPLGGGDVEVQLQEIQNIANHLDITLTQDEVKKLSDELFGKTMTFREGQIGSWKKYFNTQHKDAFKRVAGNLLIELGYEQDLNW